MSMFIWLLLSLGVFLPHETHRIGKVFRVQLLMLHNLCNISCMLGFSSIAKCWNLVNTHC